MIYELALVTREGLTQEELEKVTQQVHSAIKEDGGEILVQDEWGLLNLAQATVKGVTKGFFTYFIYKASTSVNLELKRRFRINEGVMRFLVFRAAEDSEQEKVIKSYKTPFSKRYHGSVMDGEENKQNADKDRRRFVRKKTCWFTAKNLQPDWKDPNSYSWLVNEFGKITPARVSGISRKNQRFVSRSIKMARQLGLLSSINNRVAERV